MDMLSETCIQVEKNRPIVGVWEAFYFGNTGALRTNRHEIITRIETFFFFKVLCLSCIIQGSDGIKFIPNSNCRCVYHCVCWLSWRGPAVLLLLFLANGSPLIPPDCATQQIPWFVSLMSSVFRHSLEELVFLQLTNKTFSH